MFILYLIFPNSYNTLLFMKNIVYPMANKSKSKRIFYFDALRALAIISVIVFHVFTTTNGIAAKEFVTAPTISWWIDCFLGANKIGVDLFLMLSGALSLGRDWEIRAFLSKRLPRITAPFLFWGFAIAVFMFIVLFYSPALFGSHATIPSSFDLSGFLSYLYNNYMSINKGCTQYWFFWMILGTYLIMPVLNKWLLHADLKEAEYFLFFWIITCICECTLNIKFPLKLDYFAGTIGLVVLGYYLRHTERKILNNQYFALLLVIVGCLSSMLAMYVGFTPGDAIIKFNDRLSIYIIIEVIGIFLLFKNFHKFNININFFTNPDGIFKKSVFSIAKYSYGIYLNHLVIKNLLQANFESILGYEPLILVLSVGTLVIAWLVMALLNRIHYLNQVIGAK